MIQTQQKRIDRALKMLETANKAYDAAKQLVDIAILECREAGGMTTPKLEKVMPLSPIQSKKLEYLLEQGGLIRACKIELYNANKSVCEIDAYGHVEWRS